ncbi:relaxase domain-containing protein [Streptomyces sp. NPDC006984]|uniref:relaxase domain-containing protein n=1 Tax=Streptomyces sp. NPDC006984 TaxID=3155463 RepID=UPI0033D303D8
MRRLTEAQLRNLFGAARFRHYEARSGQPLLHDHLLLSVKGQRLDGKWGSIRSGARWTPTASTRTWWPPGRSTPSP